MKIRNVHGMQRKAKECNAQPLLLFMMPIKKWKMSGIGYTVYIHGYRPNIANKIEQLYHQLR